MLRPIALLALLAALPAAAQDKPAPEAAEENVTLTQAKGEIAPLLTENEPVYFVMGTRGGTNARFQLSLKYRLFDRSLGWGRDQPWLSGIYLGYTQTTIWNLQGESKPFRDTSFRPSVFWAWERTDDKTWIDGLRAGLEHESNGKEGPDSRTIDILFVRPEWRWELANGRRLEFMPRIYGYLDKEDNPDIERYRGYVDWHLRYGNEARSWSAMARVGTAGKGSLTLGWFERTRVVGFGPMSGYFHVQFFAGYGEDILNYNQRFKSQIRLGFAIVP